MASSCATMHNVGLWSPAGVSSFHDVSFGDTLYDVQVRYPAAQPETSPSGAQALRLNSVDDNGIRFNELVYEFAYKSGMQLVMASFDPSRTRTIYDRLVHEIGPPSSSSTSSPGNSVFIWTTIAGETITLDGQSCWLVILGPSGEPLKPDIQSREQNAHSEF